MTHLVVEAESLAIAQSCARTVTILPDAILTRQVVLDAAADHPEETAQLTFDNGTEAILRPRDGTCWQPPGEGPTLDITLRVPFGLPLAIEDPGNPAYAVGGIGGSLTLTAAGSLTLTARKVAALSVTASGGARADIARVDGDVRLIVSGTAAVGIADGTVDSMAVIASGGGAVRMAAGRVEALSVEASGTSLIDLGGVVADGSATVSGDGHLVIGHLIGTLNRIVTGAGSVTIREP